MGQNYLIFFCKEDCQPCKIYRPIVEEVAAETGAVLEIFKLEAGDAQLVGDILQRYKVRSVPTVVVVRPDGSRVAGFTGGFITANGLKRALAL